MAHNDQLRPLDDEFADRLMDRVLSPDPRLSPATIRFWTQVIFRWGHQHRRINGHIARSFSTGLWNGTEYWMTDPVIQELFQGYDRATYVRPDTQAANQTVPQTSTQGVPQNSSGLLTPKSRPHVQNTPTQRLPRSNLGVTTPTRAQVVPHTPGQRLPLDSHGMPTPGTGLTDTPGRPRTQRAANPQTAATQEGGQADTTRGPTARRIPPQLESTTPTRQPSNQYAERVDVHDEPEQTHADHPAPTPGLATDGSIPPPMQPSQQDMERSHDWKGQRMPALGVRLTHVYNFLCDEDVDRDISWREHITEVEEYLLHIKTDKEFWNIGRETRDMVDRLLEMVAAHNLFEEYHYRTFNSTKVFTPDLVSKPAPRLKHDCDLPIVLRGKGGRGACRRDEIMPGDFPDQPRVQGRVNDMWSTPREARAGLTDDLYARYQEALARAEDDWWQLGADETPPGDNLSFVENKMYEDITGADGGRGLDGWVTTEEPAPGGGDGLVRIAAGPVLLGDDEDGFARERGARRAGLQGALRRFDNMENQLASTPWRRLVLPPTAEELRLAREGAGARPGRKWPLKALEPAKLRRTEGKDDPQGFTVAMAQFWRDQGKIMLRAREEVIQGIGARGPGVKKGAVAENWYVTPPKSIWGAYFWRATDPDTENHQDMLKQMRAVKELFDRELRIAPRELLTYMDVLFKLGYANECLEPDQHSVVFDDPITKTRAVLDLDPSRDFLDNTGTLNDLDKMEIYWIRFILNSSITTQMTQQIEPRTSLYIVFAERLSRIFNDISDPLFDSIETKVTVEELLDHMHKMTDGPVKMTKFYAHDAQRWLERLAAQGRCRYVDDWRCYGWVQRPVPDCHPEDLIDWEGADPGQDISSIGCPEDMVFAPRLRDLRTWGDVINHGRPPKSLDWDVANYFYSLAYRWGWYMRRAKRLERTWLSRRPFPYENMQIVIGFVEERYQVMCGFRDNKSLNPLVTLVKRTLPEKKNDATLDAAASIKIIREHIIDEAMRNDSMLWPARNAHSCTDADDEKVRPPLWDWAKVEVRGPVKKFFDVNRWPLQVQTEERQREIGSDRDLSVQQLWNPVTEDPTPWKYYRPKARPYVDEKVKHRSGHRAYPIGDTPQQKKFVEDQLYARLGRSMGIHDDNHQRPGLLGRLSGFFGRGGHDDDDDDDDDHDHGQHGSRLPLVDPKDIPKSYNPRAESDRKRKADDNAQNGPRKAVRLTSDDLPYHDGGVLDVDELVDSDLD